jgi:hypothetical protein
MVGAARAMTDRNTTSQDKAVAGAAAAATAIGSAVGSPVLGKVAGQAVQSKTGRTVMVGVVAVAVMLLVGVVVTVASVVQAASTLVITSAEPAAGSDVAMNPCTALGADATLTADQQVNATAIISTVTSRGLGASDATIAIMTALTESGLTNVTHGDLAGPDSLGLFQQRASWGTSTVRMDPAGTTGLFLDRLTAPALKLYLTSNLVNATADSRGTFAPWMVAQSVQISAFATGANYQSKYAQAVAIVSAMTGSAPGNAAKWAAAAGVTLPTLVPIVAAPTPAPSAPTAPGSTAGSGGCTAYSGIGAWGGYSNGTIPATAMATIPWAPTQMLRPDATAALVSMNVAFRAQFGYDIGVTDSYRTYAMQVTLKGTKGDFAATPGTSNHGWGLALDLGTNINTFGSAERNWMVANAPTYGWVSPSWAQAGTSEPEPWHWEFNGKTTTGAAS